MTCASDVSLEVFYALTRTRIPTALEFLAFVEAQGWRVRVGENGRAALQVPDRHCPLARSVARMLAREPYRSNVLALVMQRWRQKFTPQPAAAPVRQWVWKDGHLYTETADDTWLFGQEDRHPVGAWWWRWQGRHKLRPVPGRAGEHWITTEVGRE